MLDLLQRAVERIEADYADIRAACAATTTIKVRNGVVDEINSGQSCAFSVRVLLKGAWGFAATSRPDRLKDAIRRAIKGARTAARRSMCAGLSDERVWCDAVKTKCRINPADVDLTTKCRDLVEMNRLMAHPKVVNFEIYYADAMAERFFVSTEGASIAISEPSCLMTFGSWAKERTIQSVQRTYGGRGGYEHVSANFKRGRSITAEAVKLLKAKLLPSGRYDVLLGPRMAGTLAHEAVGHACEADAVLTGESCLKQKVGKQIASELVTIVDDPTAEAFGGYVYDDEGVRAVRTVLIEEGVLKGFLHSRETAFKMHTYSTANARAQSVSHFPLVRMSNTFFERGDMSDSELYDFEGVWIEGMRGGAVDISTGNFQFAAQTAREVRNGEFGRSYRDVVIFGNILETLRAVDGVGKRFGGLFPGLCGKGDQTVAVGDGGPKIRIRGVRVGSG